MINNILIYFKLFIDKVNSLGIQNDYYREEIMQKQKNLYINGITKIFII
jgi:hypothetical protein